MLHHSRFTAQTLLHDGRRISILQAYDQTLQRSVVVKALKPESEIPAHINRLHNEYELTRGLDADCVRRALDFQNLSGQTVLVLEDKGASPLRSALQEGGMPVLGALRIVREITKGVIELHARRIVHKDLNPDNILYDAAGGRIWIIDFDLACTLPREWAQNVRIEDLEGTLGYLSPEQSGRVAAAVDHRSDLYALGITFYEMVSGRLPFPSLDPAEIVYAHLARIPPAPEAVSRGGSIPTMVSRIIMKLIEKSPEKRYRSAFGLLADLSICIEALEGGRELGVFELGTKDISLTLTFPHRLLGREKEQAKLGEALARAAGGEPQLVLITGEAGVGKTSLVKDLGAGLLESRAILLEGKFDAFRRHLPFDGLLHAIDQRLTMVEKWGESERLPVLQRLKSLTASQASQYAYFLPALERLLGIKEEQAPLRNSDPRALRLFLRDVLWACAPDRRLIVLSLDDLQWADLESLDFLQELMLTSQNQGLLVLGAYRSGEGESSPILKSWLTGYQEAGGHSIPVELKNLDRKDVEGWLEICFSRLAEDGAAFAEILLQKTRGNPFFLRQILERLNREGCLSIDPANGQWTYCLEEVRQISFSENVVGLLIERLEELSGPCRRLLQIAACMGNPIDWDSLKATFLDHGDDARAALEEAVQGEFLIPSDAYYQLWIDTPAGTGERRRLAFAHDRVQEAAHQSLDAQTLASLHLQIARATDRGASGDQQHDFGLIRHYNLAAELIDDAEERARLASWNLVLARTAREAGSYTSCLYLCGMGMRFSGQDASENGSDVMRELSLLAGECYHLTRQYDKAAATFEEVYRRSRSPLSKAQVREAQCVLLSMTRQYEETLEKGRDALATLGLRIPRSAGSFSFLVNRIRSMRFLRRYGRNIMSWPFATDEKWDLAQRILSLMSVAAYYQNPFLTGKFAALQLEIGRRHGLHPGISLALQALSATFNFFREPAQARFTAHIGFEILERFSSYRQESRNYLSWAWLVGHWHVPVAEVIDTLKKAYRIALSSGSLADAASLAKTQSLLEIVSGRSLKLASESLERAIEILPPQSLGSERVIEDFLKEVGAVQGSGAFSEQARDITGKKEELARHGKQMAEEQVTFWHLQSVAAYIAEDYPRALAAANRAAALLRYVGTAPIMWHHLTMLVLTNFRVVQDSAASPSLHMRVGLAFIRGFLRFHARHCPENFAHQFLWVEAERLRMHGRDRSRSIKLYRQAIEGAHKARFDHHVAFAAERLGELYISLGDRAAAIACFVEAARAYERWGIPSKIRLIEQRYPEVQSFSSLRGGSIGGSSVEPGRVLLDVPTLTKASLALSAEIQIDSLLGRLLHLLVEHAGARQALMLVYEKDSGTWSIGARLTIGEAIELNLGDLAQHRSRVPLSIIQYVMRQREMLVINDAAKDRDFLRDAYWERRQSRSLLCMPIIHKGQLVSILYLENELLAGAFHPERVELLKILCAQLSVSLENAKLYRDKENAYEAEKAARRREQEVHAEWVRTEGERQVLASSMEAARLVQEALLETGPRIEECDFAWFYRPADRAGGDWFGNYYLPERSRIYVALADVTGHGLPSALVTAAIAGACASSMEILPTLGEQSLDADILMIARSVNRAVLYTGARSKQSATMVLMGLDVQQGHGFILYAAHPLAYVHDAISCRPLVARGNILGINENPEFGLLPFQLKSGGMVFLYSDGLIENVDKKGHSLKHKSLQQVLESCHEPSEVIAAFERKVDAFDSSRSLDDTSFVALKWKGSSESVADAS